MKDPKISRRDALKIMGAACATTLLAGCGVATASEPETPLEPLQKKYKRLILFFTATGNSLYIARELAGEGGTLLSIAQETHRENPVYEADEIGIVCPIFCFIPPTIVQEFIKKATFHAQYLFCIGTYGANSTIFPEYTQKLAKEHGKEMNYINTIRMVDNYLPYYDMVQQKAEDKHIPEQLAEVKAAINSRTNFIRPVNEQEKGLCEGYYRHSGRDRVNPTFTRSEKIFFTTDACIGCSVCQSVCPHESWSVVDGKGKPEGDCETCFACVHNCPSKAISIIPTPPEPEEPNRNARYRNPNVKLGDIIQANSQRKF